MSLDRSEFSHSYGDRLVKAVIISGFLLLVVSLSANVIGLGDRETFGQSQIMGGVAGFTLMLGGLVFYFRKRFGAGILSASLVIVAVCISLAGAEIGLRLTVSQRTAAKWNPTDEVFWRFNWLDYGDTRSNARIIYHPTLGWGPKPDYRSEFFNLNSRGIRGLREYSYEKPPGESRIVVTGDSFTFGSVAEGSPPVLDQAVYTAKLEQLLPGTSVINLGVDGYGTDQQLLMLREEGFKYNPDLVIAAIYMDDLYRSTLSFRDYAKPKFELQGEDLVLTRVPVTPPEDMERTVKPVTRMFTWALVRSALGRLTRESGPHGWIEIRRLNAAILDELNEEVHQRGASLLILVVPTAGYRERIAKGEQFLEDWGQQTNVPVWSPRLLFESLSQETQGILYNKIDHHWTPLTHELVAEALRTHILENRFLTNVRSH